VCWSWQAGAGKIRLREGANNDSQTQMAVEMTAQPLVFEG